MNEALIALACYDVTGLADGAVELTCKRCRATKVFGLAGKHEVVLATLVIWGRHHQRRDDRLLVRAAQLVTTA
jgi:hypothetical protein